MRLINARIKNFKALADADIPLSNFTVILGSNGSGKSSVLQALHWAIQSARNPKVDTKKAEKGEGSTLSQNDADFLPSPDYKNASHEKPFGNFKNTPRMDVKLSAIIDELQVDAEIWLKAARNEGITVHAPSSNSLISNIRDRKREFSSYIPGLAGIPLQEERRSARIVHRQAAAGDANTVLRNLLLRLKDLPSSMSKGTALNDVEFYASQVMEKFSIQVNFDEETDFWISATFQTETMKSRDPKLWKPLELAGIGFLQVLQIFAYLIFYRPKLFLVDEPDSHLHPDRQEKLVNVLIAAAEKLDTQVVMATHSPSVVRSLGADATIVWMQDGTVTGDIVQARKQMGWGLLDKKILVLSEDSNVRLLKNLIEQWPDIDRRTAVWPLNGVKTLPAPESLSGMKSLFGDSMQLVLHRDGDFLNKDERKCWAKPYEEKGITPWITPASDLEACFLSAEIISKVLGIDETTAIELLRSAIESRKDNCEKNFAEKREEHRKNNKLRIKGASIPSNEEVKKELLSSSIIGASVGKEIAKQLRQDTNGAYSNSGDLAKVCPEGAIVAPCLKAILEKLLN